MKLADGRPAAALRAALLKVLDETDPAQPVKGKPRLERARASVAR